MNIKFFAAPALVVAFAAGCAGGAREKRIIVSERQGAALAETAARGTAPESARSWICTIRRSAENSGVYMTFAGQIPILVSPWDEAANLLCCMPDSSWFGGGAAVWIGRSDGGDETLRFAFAKNSQNIEKAHAPFDGDYPNIIQLGAAAVDGMTGAWFAAALCKSANGARKELHIIKFEAAGAGIRCESVNVIPEARCRGGPISIACDADGGMVVFESDDDPNGESFIYAIPLGRDGAACGPPSRVAPRAEGGRTRSLAGAGVKGRDAIIYFNETAGAGAAPERAAVNVSIR